MLNLYAIIDYVGDQCYSYTDDIEMGYHLDMILDHYDRYELPYYYEKYNNGRVYVIKLR
jgi:hypothetical protein